MNDVSLSDGLAYMVEDEPYQLHVASAAENTEVSACIQKVTSLLTSYCSDPPVKTIGLSMMLILPGQTFEPQK